MRARNIKPGFVKNEELAQCSPLARLLFAGLWMMADRNGRLEDRPKRIKAEILPYDKCNIENLLGELEKRTFLVRYASDGEQYISLPKFSKHQHPHKNEPESTIPAPDKNGARTRVAPESSGANPADSLIPDSLIPDSSKRIPEQPPPDIDNSLEQIRSWLHEFMQHKWPMPDRLIAEQIYMAIDGDLLALQQFLLQLHNQKRKPEKSWVWFVEVVRSHFGGRK